MNRVTSALLAGVISAVIWIVISLLVGMPAATVWTWAVVMLVGVAAITFAISTVIGTARRRT